MIETIFRYTMKISKIKLSRWQKYCSVLFAVAFNFIRVCLVFQTDIKKKLNVNYSSIPSYDISKLLRIYYHYNYDIGNAQLAFVSLKYRINIWLLDITHSNVVF